MLNSNLAEPSQKLPNHNKSTVCSIKLSHFDPQIDLKTFINSSRYAKQQNPIKKRQMNQTAHSIRTKKSMPIRKNDISIQQLHENKHETQCFQSSPILINVKFEEYSPLLREKINQLRSQVYKKQPKETPQNVHFTSYLMNYNYSRDPILHSRNKKESAFMKSIKAKNLINKSLNKRQNINDNFSSIQINDTSKYAKTRRMSINGTNLKTKITSIKDKLASCNRLTKSRSQNRQRKQNKSKLLHVNMEQDCKPWQTSKQDVFHFQDDQYIINY